jgi:hypothetical protein
MDAFMDICGVSFLELLKDTYLDLACVTVLLDSTNNLDRYTVLSLEIDCFYHFTEGPLPEKANRAIAIINYVVWDNNVMALLIVTRDDIVGRVCGGRPAAARPGLGGEHRGLLLVASGDLLDEGPTGVVGQVSLPLLWRWCH